MNKLTPLLFPDTLVTDELMRRELFFFEQIMFYQPVEPEQEDLSAADQLCRAYCPAPLGEDRERFALLLQELKGHEKEFYNGMLSSMNLEYLENRDSETTLELIMSMQGKPAPNRKNQKTDEEKILWQARLMLKLAEIRQQEDDEIGEVLSSIAEKEKNLFQKIKGVEEIINDPAISAGVVPAPIKIEPLLRAWGHLFLVDHRPVRLLNTANDEAAAILLDVDETLAHQAPEKICRLPLPLVDSAKFSWNRKTFHQEAASTIDKLGRLLQDAAENGGNDSICRQLDEAAAEWEKKLDEQGLTADKTVLEFYCCSNSLADIMAHFCKPAVNSRQDTCPAHGLLAVRID
jgi:hypothetical protein